MVIRIYGGYYAYRNSQIIYQSSSGNKDEVMETMMNHYAKSGWEVKNVICDDGQIYITFEK